MLRGAWAIMRSSGCAGSRRNTPSSRDVRGKGLMLGVELMHPGTRERATDAAEALMYAALERGLSFKVTMGNILTLTPALVITETQLDDAVRILDESFTAVGF